MAEDATPNADKAADGKSASEKAPESASEKPAKAATAAKSDAKPAAKAKEKPPKVEEKPFTEFIQQHYLPDVESALKEEGLSDLQLAFEKQPLAAAGTAADPVWQVIGQWDGGQKQFNIGFIDEDIKGQKVFSCATSGAVPSTIEQFMGDERRITLDLLVMYTVQRLNGQKWLTRN